ncbi:hypothetical protein NDS46_19070 [Paenibacillus thiaminolyticus]|uniref:hypothetical protein n=1 Tax=Paenibacillus thiaminolyticus TaxID=49283 RepID=UPI00232A99F8|nr:hypothetical protein [Paenibacillus thiaminolyticus]WCF06449.1 hypothetical protein NDS46_19070 [Paenibacillus thiaminolyticus]
MLFKSNSSKLIVLFLTFVLIFISPVNLSLIQAEGHKKLDGVEVLVNNKNEIRLKTEVDGLVGILVQDKSTKELSLTTYKASKVNPNLFFINTSSHEEIKHYSLSLNDFTDSGAHITFQDLETGQETTLNPDEITPRFVWVVPLVEVIGAKLIEALLLTAAVVAINEIEFAKTDSVVETLRNNNRYDHYYAKIMQGDVWIGPAISESGAVARLVSFNGDKDVSGNDVWSRTMSKAALVAKKAGGGKEPVGPEIEGPGLGFGFYYHYHTWNRVGGHSFF